MLSPRFPSKPENMGQVAAPDEGKLKEAVMRRGIMTHPFNGKKLGRKIIAFSKWLPE